MLTLGPDKRYPLFDVASGGRATAKRALSSPLTPKEDMVLTSGAIGRRRIGERRGKRGAVGLGLLGTAALSIVSLATAMVGPSAGVAGAATAGETPDPATQSAVTIGMITDGGGSSAIGTAALVEEGAKAAVSYLNAYGGGLAGHKVTLYVCENQSTPAGGQTCANDMVQHGVVAVVEPFTGQGATEVPTIVAAGIPYIMVSGGSTAELTTPGAYDLEGGFPAYLGAMALSAKAHGLKKVTFLVENVPAAIQGAQVFGAMVYKAAGVGFAVVPVNAGTADISPQMQSAVSGGADAVGMVGDVTLCTPSCGPTTRSGSSCPATCSRRARTRASSTRRRSTRRWLVRTSRRRRVLEGGQRASMPRS